MRLGSTVVVLATFIFVTNIWLIQIGTPVEAAQELLFAMLMPLLILWVAAEMVMDFKPEWIVEMDERGWLRGGNNHD